MALRSLQFEPRDVVARTAASVDRLAAERRPAVAAALPIVSAQRQRAVERRRVSPACSVRDSSTLAARIAHLDPRRSRGSHAQHAGRRGGRGRRRAPTAGARRRRRRPARPPARRGRGAGRLRRRRRRRRRRVGDRRRRGARRPARGADGRRPRRRPTPGAGAASAEADAAAGTRTSAADQQQRDSQNTGRRSSAAQSRGSTRAGPLAERRVQAVADVRRARRARASAAAARSTGAGSIFSARQTVCASARAKVASGSSSKRSASSASSFRRHLDRRGQRGDVQALRSRAPRAAAAPAVGAPPARRRVGAVTHRSARARRPRASRDCGKRLRSWRPKLARRPARLPSLFSMRAASHSVCALRRSGMRVDAADVEARALELAAPVQHLGQVDRGDRVAGSSS